LNQINARGIKLLTVQECSAIQGSNSMMVIMMMMRITFEIQLLFTSTRKSSYDSISLGCIAPQVRSGSMTNNLLKLKLQASPPPLLYNDVSFGISHAKPHYFTTASPKNIHSQDNGTLQLKKQLRSRIDTTS